MKRPYGLRVLLSAAPAVFLLGSVFAFDDPSSLPPDPVKVNRRYERTLISLVEAIRNAEREIGGKAINAAYRTDDTRVIIEVTISKAGKATRATIDPETGQIKDRKPVEENRFPGVPVGDAKLRTTKSGLAYYELKVGTGPSPGPKSRVTIHYAGYLPTGKKFDSSYDRKQPMVFDLSGVIKGWQEGIGSMRVGGKRKLVVPPDLAYGDLGTIGIPAKSRLVFDVELLAVKP